VLVALVLLSIAFFGIASGLLTTMEASTGNDGRVVAETALTQATEAMKQVGPSTGGGPAAYRACTSTIQAQALADALVGASPTLADGRSFAVRVTGVAYWDRTTQDFAAGCTAATESGAQLVELAVTIRATTIRGSVVLRDPSARPPS
jgi:hypothetical protein